MLKRGQPYLGAFLLKDENTDSDVRLTSDINSVHELVSLLKLLAWPPSPPPGRQIVEPMTGMFRFFTVSFTSLTITGPVQMAKILHIPTC
jgi:hypothetical protein